MIGLAQIASNDVPAPMVRADVHQRIQQQLASAARSNQEQPPSVSAARANEQRSMPGTNNGMQTSGTLQVREVVPEAAKDIMATLERGQIDGHLVSG